jgi:NAD(P)H dehydrogenase (quinone)
MTQSDNASIEITPPEGDLETARKFGKYLVELKADY